jgi:hypothetical protein
VGLKVLTIFPGKSPKGADIYEILPFKYLIKAQKDFFLFKFSFRTIALKEVQVRL